MSQTPRIDGTFVTRWLEQDFDEVRPGIHGARVDSEQLTVSVYRYEPHSEWEVHEHPEDQLTTVVEGGEIEFTIDGASTVLCVGQMALIPGGVPHSARNGDRDVVAVNVWRRRL